MNENPLNFFMVSLFLLLFASFQKGKIQKHKKEYENQIFTFYCH